MNRLGAPFWLAIALFSVVYVGSELHDYLDGGEFRGVVVEMMVGGV